MKNKRSTKILSLILVLVMAFSLVPVSALAESTQETAGGTSGWSGWGTWGWGGQRNDPQPEPEAPAEEPITPTVKLSETVDGLTVTAEAPEGVLPEGTEMTVTPVRLDAVQAAVDSTEGVSGTVLAAADITFLLDGEEIQPDGEITVTMTSAQLADAKNTSVVHLDTTAAALENDEADVEAEPVEDVTVDAESVTFGAEHFSVYVIVSGDEVVTFRRTYQFTTDGTTPFMFYNKAGEEVNEQVVKNGDTLEVVGVPYTAGKVFKGWGVTDNGGDATITVGTVLTLPIENLSGINMDATVVLKAVFDDIFYVTFHETKRGDTPDIIQTKKAADENNEVVVSDVIAPQPDSSHIFYAWSDGTNTYPVYDEDNQPISNVKISDIQSDLDLYPIFVEAYWLRYVAGETGSRAKYVPAQFVRANQTLTQLPVSERTGYTFAGWYTGSMEGGKITYGDQVTDGTGKVVNPSTGLTLTAETTLYGKWTPNTNAQYTVILWRQKVSDSKDAADEAKTYDYVTSDVRNGTTDDPCAATDADKSHSGGDYTGFHFARTTQNSNTINADNSTVINVYYDRDLMAINFYYQNGHQPTGAVTAYVYTRTYNNNGTQYGLMDDGTYVELTRKEVTTYTDYWTYRDSYNRQFSITSQYCDHKFYVSNGSGGYTATEYTQDNFPPADDSRTFYAYDTYDEAYYQLSKSTTSNTEYAWVYKDENDVEQTYTGNRYTRSTNSSYPYMVTFTGLYGQNFTSDQKWPSNYKWNEQSNGGGTTQTFLTAFTQTETPYNLYDQGSTGSSTIYHYKQGLDGKYSTATGYRYEAKSNNGSFTFSDKFAGFSVMSYNTGTNGFNANGGSTSARDSSGKPKQSQSVDYPLHVYHERNKWSITYKSEGAVVHTESNIYFEAPISDKNLTQTQAGLADKPHYEFKGWYADETCKTPFNFSSTMPNANVVVYAKWEPVWYQIIVDPDGGVITTDIGSTYFWKQYGDTFDRYEGVVRQYIEDPNGTYKYVYVDGKNDPDGNIKIRTATYETAESGYTGTKYRPMTASDPEYILVGWYVVDSNGNITDTPYDFSTEVEAPVTIRAKWRLSGSYKLQYIPTATVGEDTVTGTFTQSEPNAEYADASTFVIQGGPSNVTAGYIFDGWEIVENATGNVLDDNSGIFYQPGDEVELDAAAWARNKIVHLRAHYTKVEGSDKPLEVTKLILNANGGGVSGVTESAEGVLPIIKVNDTNTVVSITKLRLNASVNLDEYSPKFSYTGYRLVGWNTLADGSGVSFNPDDVVGLDEMNREKNTNVNTLYAQWEAVFYVVTSHDAVVKQYTLSDLTDGKINLCKIAEDNGYYYGGYYKVYAGLDQNSTLVKNTADGDSLGDAYKYDGSVQKATIDSTKIMFFAKMADAYTAPGNTLEPTVGAIYYVKEVSDRFLTSRVQYVYDYSNNDNIDVLYLLTAVDDKNYSNVGFTVETADHDAKLVASFTFQQHGTDKRETVKATTLGAPRGFLAYWNGSSELIKANSEFTMTPFWVTPDGVPVAGAAKTYQFGNGTTVSDLTIKP